MPNDIRDHTIQAEVVKTSLRQTKDGVYITFVLHPSDNSDRLVAAHVGQRYIMALAELDDRDELVKDPLVEAGEKAVTSAVMLCKEPEFQVFVGYTVGRVILDEDTCKGALCTYLGIGSRSELKENMTARESFHALRGEFLDHKKLHP